MKELLILLILNFSGNCYSEETVIEVDGGLKVGQKVEEREDFNITPYRSFLKATPEGKPYGIYDGLVSAKDQVLLKELLTFDIKDWLFNNYDSENENEQRSFDNTAWINNQDPKLFSGTQLSNRILEAVKDVSKDAGQFYPYKVYAKILRRGDNTKVVADSDNKDEFSAMIFMNEHWRKNYYGELYFYDDNKEIVGGSTSKSARLVVWQSNIFRLNRPPAVQFLQGQLLFHVQYTKDIRKMEQGHLDFTNFQETRDEAHQKWNLPEYQLPNKGIDDIDIDKHKKFEYTTKTDGRKLWVFDDLFPKETLDHLRSFVLKFGTYYYDDSIDKESDNVQWVAGFRLDPYIKSPYWKIIQKAAHHVTGNNELFPYDVSINLIRNADFTRIHKDVGYHGEEEYTCLVYLNPNWKKDYYGETAFFEKNSDDTEIVAQVKPKYGRLVIFDGNIPHSARPPSFNFTGARLSFVTKLHRNEYAGRRKNFQEELRFFRSTVGMNYDLTTLGSSNGEQTASERLKESVLMQEKLSYRPDPEMGGEEREEDEDEEEGEEGTNNNHQQSNEKENSDEGEENQATLEPGKKFVIRRDPPFELDEEADSITQKLLQPMMGLVEGTPDAVQIIMKTHEKMIVKENKYLKRFRKKGYEIL